MLELQETSDGCSTQKEQVMHTDAASRSRSRDELKCAVCSTWDATICCIAQR